MTHSASIIVVPQYCVVLSGELYFGVEM